MTTITVQIQYLTPPIQWLILRKDCGGGFFIGNFTQMFQNEHIYGQFIWQFISV